SASSTSRTFLRPERGEEGRHSGTPGEHKGPFVMVAVGIEVVLCDRPEQRELLGETPGLAVPADNETMHHSGISNALLRRGRRTRGGPISGGHDGFANTAAANRDPAIYDDPDRFDITREGLPPIMSFARASTTASTRTWPGWESPRH